jgi:succinate dehydrogenase/fumarate reductase flavoprotein subunit
MSKMATAIFLKGYQWPFDPQRIENHQSSLVDILVFNETQKGRRVFMDFRKNPIGHNFMNAFDIKKLEPEAREYLEKAGALQKTPIKRLLAMNPLAIDIYKEHGIDLHTEPLEIAVCAQHNNGGFAVNKWWESNIPGTFVIGEMAGTHGVKRPGGSALNAGQVGGLRAAEYIVNVYGCELPDYSESQSEIDEQLNRMLARFAMGKDLNGPMPKQVIKKIQKQMTASAGHIRELKNARKALKATVELYENILKNGISMHGKKELIWSIRAESLMLTGIAFLKAICRLLELGEGSRGSHLVIAGDGIEIHRDVIHPATGKTLKFKPENTELKNSILRVEYDDSLKSYFKCDSIKPRKAPADRKAFEPAWRDFREGKIYSDDGR